MARFERPTGALKSHAELQKWDVIWHVYGIWPPFVSGPEVVVRQPYRNKGGDMVFDTRKPRRDFVETHFASDGNMITDHSHNDNYWFKSEEEAEAAKEWLHAEWQKNPEMIAEVMSERAIERELDRMDAY